MAKPENVRNVVFSLKNNCDANHTHRRFKTGKDGWSGAVTAALEGAAKTRRCDGLLGPGGALTALVTAAGSEDLRRR